MFGVYVQYDGVLGLEEMLMESFNTEAEAEAYMAQLIAEDIEAFGEPCDAYFVIEVE